MFEHSQYAPLIANFVHQSACLLLLIQMLSKYIVGKEKIKLWCRKVSMKQNTQNIRNYHSAEHPSASCKTHMQSRHASTWCSPSSELQRAWLHRVLHKYLKSSKPCQSFSNRKKNIQICTRKESGGQKKSKCQHKPPRRDRKANATYTWKTALPQTWHTVLGRGNTPFRWKALSMVFCRNASAIRATPSTPTLGPQ